MDNFITKSIKKSDINTVFKYLNEIRDNSDINNLFNILESQKNVYLVGGAIRDIAVRQVLPRDIDNIVEKEEELDKALNDFKYTKNRFGGFKLEIGNLYFDIWTMKDHWAFKKGIFECNYDNLSKTTFLNIDSLILDLKNQKFQVEIFNRAIEEKLLDITLPNEYITENPTPEVNILRLLIFKKEWGLEFSDLVNEYIFSWLDNSINHISKLIEAQKKHYKLDKISKKEIKYQLFQK
ncbi:MAG: hypothetical protein ACOCV1_05345 [Bacillota bacterium]